MKKIKFNLIKKTFFIYFESLSTITAKRKFKNKFNKKLFLSYFQQSSKVSNLMKILSSKHIQGMLENRVQL